MRVALFLRMTNCNAFAGRCPCPIAEYEKWALFWLSLCETLKFGGQDLIAGCRGMKNAPCFWLLTWSRIWFGGSNWGLDLPGRVILGVKLDHRPPGRLIWGVKLGHRPPRKSNLGGQIGPPTSRKGNLGGQIGPPTSRKGNLGVILASSTCPTP